MKWIKRKPKTKQEHENGYDLSDLTDEIAYIRGIPSEHVGRFLHPTEDEMFDPYGMKNIEDAGQRIIDAIQEGQRVSVSVDVDTDGITSAVLMIRYLRNYLPHDKVDYIYAQRDHGHGLYEQVRTDVAGDWYKLTEENNKKLSKTDLLIVVDSSSNDIDGVEETLERHNLDIVILDHHEIDYSLPRVDKKALLVNPQQKGDEYPNKDLSGVGVVYKTIQVVEDMLEDYGMSRVDTSYYMDLVAVGQIGDMMSVESYENRYMMQHGLRNMNNVGLRRILKGAKKNPDFNIVSSDVSFSISPIINASARMGQIELAIDLLLTDDDEEAKPLRLKMSKLNDKRKEIQYELVSKYREQVNEKDKIILIIDSESNRGFNGLVAQDLAQEFKRPCFVMREHRGKLSGSGRSYGKFDTQEFLEPLGFVETQGHAQAHGIDLPLKQLGDLEEYIKEEMPSLKEESPYVLYDIQITPDEIIESIPVIESFNHLTGTGFPEIKVRVDGVMVDERSVIGKNMNTVKVTTMDDLELIKFRVNDRYASDISMMSVIDVVGTLGMNRFYHFGKRELIQTPQIMLDDYKKK